MSHDLQIGVYFSANDVVYDWAIAFLNSFRTFNPDLRLILIPFNDECDRLLKLKHTYNFEIHIDPSFERLEAIGQAFELGHTPTGPYWFRRYAAFWGPCDRFMYLDARQIILADLKPVLSALDDFDFDLLHFDCAVHQVYESGDLRREFLRKGKARGFLSGLWASRKGLFTLERFEQLSAKALQSREQLNPRNTDQAFINYSCDADSVRCGHVSEVLGDTCQINWAKTSGKVYKEKGKYYLWDYGGLDHKRQFFLLHWAGYSLNAFMPNHSLFIQFRWMDKPFFIQKARQCTALLKSLPAGLLLKMRKNRWISDVYHNHYSKN